ncbi:MAG: GGDEF domain-containing protein [Candidatus Brocadiae bacterium]|nr:GGDEF domain-containing protein [Candidatus Brocadiia bacterium]
MGATAMGESARPEAAQDPSRPLAGDPVAELRAEKQRLETLVRKQALDFKTLLEMANAINERSLDPRGIESYLSYICHAVRGQFGVTRAHVVRETPEGEGRRYQLVDRGRLSFECDAGSPFVLALTRASGAMPLTHPDLTQLPESAKLRALELETVAPLLRFQDGKPELKGILAVGRRLVRAPFAPEDLQMFGLLGSILAISLHNAELHRRAIVDGLTQVYSRGHFDLALDAEIARVERYGTHHRDEDRKVSLVMMDIDHFKKINDAHGHQVGDAVLRAVAHATKLTVRKSDLVARYGGEEFALIAPETNKEEGIRMAERLRARILDSKVEGPGGKPIAVTASFGVATFPGDAADLRGLVAAADRALYQAKERGRNQVVAAPTREHA